MRRSQTMIQARKHLQGTTAAAVMHQHHRYSVAGAKYVRVPWSTLEEGTHGEKEPDRICQGQLRPRACIIANDKAA